MQRGRSPYAQAHRVEISDTCHWERHGLPLMCRYVQQRAGDHATALGVGLDVLLPQGLSWALASTKGMGVWRS